MSEYKVCVNILCENVLIMSLPAIPNVHEKYTETKDSFFLLCGGRFFYYSNFDLSSMSKASSVVFFTNPR